MFAAEGAKCAFLVARCFQLRPSPYTGDFIAIPLMAESDSIELLTRQRYHGFQDRLRSQPRHSPYFFSLRIVSSNCLLC